MWKWTNHRLINFITQCLSLFVGLECDAAVFCTVGDVGAGYGGDLECVSRPKQMIIIVTVLYEEYQKDYQDFTKKLRLVTFKVVSLETFTKILL